MAMLPTTPTSRWVQQLDQPFRIFEDAFDRFQDYQLYEEDDAFILTVDMPGFDPEAISVTWDDGVLNIGAEQIDEERDHAKTYHRRFRFPKHVDEDAIDAEYTNGVLEVTLPVMEGTTIRGKEIPIKS